MRVSVGGQSLGEVDVLHERLGHLGYGRELPDQPGGNGGRRRPLPGQLSPEIDHFTERNGRPAQNIRFADAPLLGGQDVTFGDIIDKGVGHNALRGRNHRHLTAIECAHQIGKGAGIPRAVYAAGHDDDDGRALLNELLGHLVVSDPLRAIIFRQERPAAVIGLINEFAVGMAENSHGTGVDDAWNSQFVSQAQNIARAGHVDGFTASDPLRCEVIGAGDMENQVTTTHPRPHGLSLYDISEGYGRAQFAQHGGSALRPAEGNDLIVAFNQLANQALADKSCSAGYKCLHCLFPAARGSNEPRGSKVG